MSDLTVEATNIHKSYLLGATAVGALRGVDLTVRRGEFVALMGPSGCGKTTLLNVIGAIDLPTCLTHRPPLGSAAPHRSPCSARPAQICR